MNYARPDIAGMEYGRILRQMMTAGDMTQTELAEKLHVSQPTISRWLAGVKPEYPQHIRIVAEARRLGVLPAEGTVDPTGDLLEDLMALSAPRTIRVVGYVGAGAEALFFPAGDLDEVPAPAGSTEQTVAVEIRGESLGLLFDRWLVFYDEVRRPATADLVGKLCVVGLADGRVLIKKLRPARGGRFNLVSEREPTIENVAIEWAAPVKTMTPQ